MHVTERPLNNHKNNMSYRTLALISGLFVGAGALLATLSPAMPSVVSFVSPYCTTEIPQPTILAHAGFAYDVGSGTVLFSKNADAQLPLASLTKLMTVLTALRALPPTSTVTITADSLSPDGEYGLKVGERWTARDLANFTLIASANDGARALMLAAVAALHEQQSDFFKAMNTAAQNLGLSQTFFLNETGLDVSTTTAGAYGSAHDVAHLIAYAALQNSDSFEDSVLPKANFVSLSGVTHSIENTSMTASSLLSSRASKTGYTDLAGGNLAVVFEPVPGHPVAVAVLGSTREGRDADVSTVAKYVSEVSRRAILCSSSI